MTIASGHALLVIRIHTSRASDCVKEVVWKKPVTLQATLIPPPLTRCGAPAPEPAPAVVTYEYECGLE
jgi:hypothetical protein